MTDETTNPPGSRKTIRRWLLIVLGGLLLLLVFVFIGLFTWYKTGYADNYIKAQFVSKMADIGIVFEADVFRVTINPLRLQLKNATFNDKVSGDKLFFIRDADLGLTVQNLYAWQLSRDIQLNSTEINGAEAWVKFDENGKSNFSNLNFIEDKSGSLVNFKYDSVNFSLHEGLVHFGDVQHKISADAKNVIFVLSPTNSVVPDEQKRYNFDLTSTNSKFIYDDKPLEPIDLLTKGIADNKGAEIQNLTLKTPLGESNLSGTLTDWERLQYNLKINSTVDLQQTAGILPTGATLRGIGNFEGTVTGEGAKYQVNGEINSDSLAADNIYLKGLQINGKVAGENAIYEGNGKAIAEMLTFEDFRIDFPQLIGNVRGNGTDFKWFGELQAAAAKSPDGTLAGLFISDAVAEYKDKQFTASFSNLRANSLNSEDLIAQNLRVTSIKVNSNNGTTTINAPNIKAGTVKAKGTELNGVDANGIKVTSRGDKTDAEINNLRAENLRTKDAKLRNVTANGVSLTTQNGATDIQAKNVQAEGVDAESAKVGNIQAGSVNVKIRGNQTDVVSDNLRVAKIDTADASFGSLNIAGVRLKIVQGRVEGTSGDIDAGTVDLKKNGKLENAKFYKPVFVLEPSGRYRASMDMSLGGGVLGSVTLGAARASVVADNDKVALNNLTADVMDGKINGNAVIAMNQRTNSKVDAEFSNLDLAKLLALQGGKVIPIAGETTGKADLTFPGTNFKNASGTVVADFKANAGSEDRGLVPINGNLGLNATNGLFDIDYAKLNTEKSSLNATGRFDLNDSNSNLNLALDSTDATEIERLVRVLNLSPELEQQLNENELTFAGNLKFNGTLTGNLQNPNVDGRASVDSVVMRGKGLGSLATNILVSPQSIELRDGILQETNGGNLAFNLNIPQTGSNNISVDAKLNRVNTGNLLAALPVKYLPEKLRDFNAETSGTINLTGLPNEVNGTANLKSGSGTVAGQPFDGFEANLTFQGTTINVEKFDAQFADGFLRATGTYQRDTTDFNFNLEGKNLQASRFRPFVTDSKDFPDFSGTIDLTAKATGKSNDFKTFDVNFQGVGNNIKVNENALGRVDFVGKTENQLFKADLTANLEGQQQVISTTVNFANENLPFRAETNFNQTELAPFIALLQTPGSVAVSGKATGKVFAEGNLYAKDANGNGYFTFDDIKGLAQFSEFGLQFDETPIMATKPISISFNSREVIVENAQFAGAGSNLVVNGTKALNNSGVNNLSVNGSINLRLLNLASKNTFYSGVAEVSMRLTGVNKESRLSGSAKVENASISTFVGSERLNFERIKCQLLFTINQAQMEQCVGYLGGGKVIGTGGALVEGLKLQQARLELHGQNITTPLPKNFLTTGDAEVEITTKREGENFNTLIAGTIFAKRSSYTKDIDLADFISSRRDASISEGTSPPVFGIPRLDLRLQGRDALVVRNNLADLTASVDLRVTGDVDYPVLSGRVTANSGTVFFRSDRYEVQRGTLEFPPQADSEPYINLQAEADIKGYQVFVNLVGELNNFDALTANVRSNPALPQADVISLITTGNLSNSDSGIPTYAQSGLNTAAEVITDSLINNPVRKATDKLFGLNKFEIDPILSGRRLNPTARLTVGRQINKNLAITYSTNLSEDQNQVLAFEYRISNRLSFVAQYEQGSLSNVTRSNNNFSFEIRLRKRF
ncbi:MAG: translocation/assembly module TamB domain-containing protein [Pyrinomonadaceae bacterium]|nr:translocation/assembly module TamB domain-containing protein [Pyrinomonadaceae bacterium]